MLWPSENDSRFGFGTARYGKGRRVEGCSRWVMGLKEDTSCNGHWVSYALNSTSETRIKNLGEVLPNSVLSLMSKHLFSVPQSPFSPMPDTPSQSSHGPLPSRSQEPGGTGLGELRHCNQSLELVFP